MTGDAGLLTRRKRPRTHLPTGDRLWLALSIGLQVALGYFLGHAYDMRIFLSTGYLTATGQNPYIAQNLGAIFRDASFNGITSIGYPPPWALVLGLVYLLSYRMLPNLMIYNLAIKLPIIAANFCLAYEVKGILRKLKVEEGRVRHAWLFMLFNPFLLLVTTAWGQFDTIVALLALMAVRRLADGKIAQSAILLALGVAFKPTALPLLAAAFIFLKAKPWRSMLLFFGVLTGCGLLFIVSPFLVFHWDPGFILQHWNAQFSVGGGLSFLSFLELARNSYQLSGGWWLTGLLWVPALGAAALLARPGRDDLPGLIKTSTAMVLIFFLFRSWVSETNLILVLPMILILVMSGELEDWVLTAVWTLPLAFSFFNTSLFQLLFPCLPGLMNQLLQFSDTYRIPRLVLRLLTVIPWLVLEGRIILKCMQEKPAKLEKILSTDTSSHAD